MGIREEIREAILGGHLYDFISNNQHRLSKYELVELVKNLDYTAYQEESYNYESFNKNVVENLNDVDFFEE